MPPKEDQNKLRLLRKDPSRFLYLAMRSSIPNRIEDYILDLVRPRNSHVVNDMDLRFLGMRRSGNHAVIDWFIRSVVGENETTKHIFLNNIEAKRNGYRSRYHFPEPDDPPSYTKSLASRRWRTKDHLDLLVRSYEDYTLETFFPPEPQKYYGSSRLQRNYLILRDPLNLLASRRKSGKIATRDGTSEIDLYLNHAKVLQESVDQIRCVLYNRWLTDEEYRTALARDLGVSPAPMSSRPTKQGGGSSFSGSDLDITASSVTTRWKSSADQGFLDDVMKDERIRDIVNRYFPEIV